MARATQSGSVLAVGQRCAWRVELSVPRRVCATAECTPPRLDFTPLQLMCHPGAQCYKLDDPARKYAHFKDVTGSDESDKAPGEACQTFCKDTSGIGCCNFSTPYLECGGCDETNDCNPGAKCYKTLKAEL